jgi:hypothetical protein
LPRVSVGVDGTSGSLIDGRIAQIHWNTGWDLPNRFEVLDVGLTARGHAWRMLKNRWSGKCLAAAQVWGRGYVIQQECNASQASQFWVAYWNNGTVPTAVFRNLAHDEFNNGVGLGTIMTQSDDQVGSHFWMEVPHIFGPHAEHATQRWFVESCKVTGSEQQHC